MSKNQPYSLLKVNTYSYLVISINSNRLDEIIPILTTELKRKKIKGDIFFDLLLTNGNTSSRFISGEFDGVQFSYQSLKKIKPEQSILKKTNAYLQKHIDILYTGILNKRDIKKFLEESKM